MVLLLQYLWTVLNEMVLLLSYLRTVLDEMVLLEAQVTQIGRRWLAVLPAATAAVGTEAEVCQLATEDIHKQLVSTTDAGLGVGRGAEPWLQQLTAGQPLTLKSWRHSYINAVVKNEREKFTVVQDQIVNS